MTVRSVRQLDSLLWAMYSPVKVPLDPASRVITVQKSLAGNLQPLNPETPGGAADAEEMATACHWLPNSSNTNDDCSVGPPVAFAAATRAMVRHGFFDLNLHRIYVSILRENVASIRMCANAGFREEGTIRQGAYKNGAYHDLVLMGVLKSEVSEDRR